MSTIEFSILEPFSNIDFMPVPAKKSIPSWLKNLAAETRQGAPTAKKCPPFVDVFSLGYTIPAWQEFSLLPNDGFYNFKAGITHIHSPYENPRPICSYQFPEQYANTPLEGYQVIKIQTPWIIKTPPNISLLVVPPFGSDNLEIEAIPAVIDSDHYHTNFGFTCKVKYDPTRSITIAPGTPLAQIIPFERKSWNMTVTETSMLEHSKFTNKLKSYIMSGYRKLFWQKKDYN